MCSDKIKNIFTNYLEKAVKRRKATYVAGQRKTKEKEGMTNEVAFSRNYNEFCISDKQVTFEQPVDDILQGLRSIEREILILKVFGQFSYKEIGERTHMSAQQAAAIYGYTKKKLRKRRKKNGI